ncbi:MAG: hypothetical protein ACTHN5_03220 [Phycisphaerae bacterium]
MGAHPYWYTVPYEEDVNAALQKLRQREFVAGRYNPVITELRFPIAREKRAPGNQHKSIAEALKGSGYEGTRSILDISGISSTPQDFRACPLPGEVLMRLYGTSKPTHAIVDQIMKPFFREVERGQAIYIVLYKDDSPNEILFAGYSFD